MNLTSAIRSTQPPSYRAESRRTFRETKFYHSNTAALVLSFLQHRGCQQSQQRNWTETLKRMHKKPLRSWHLDTITWKKLTAVTDIQAEELPKVTYQAARLSDSVAQLGIKGGQIITWPHLSAGGRAGLSEGLGPVLRLVPWQSTSSLLPAVARESWRNTGGQGWMCPLQAAPGARCPRLPLISILYFPLTSFSLSWQQQCNTALARGFVIGQNSRSINLALGRLQRPQRWLWWL